VLKSQKLTNDFIKFEWTLENAKRFHFAKMI